MILLAGGAVTAAGLALSRYPGEERLRGWLLQVGLQDEVPTEERRLWRELVGFALRRARTLTYGERAPNLRAKSRPYTRVGQLHGRGR